MSRDSDTPDSLLLQAGQGSSTLRPNPCARAHGGASGHAQYTEAQGLGSLCSDGTSAGRHKATEMYISLFWKPEIQILGCGQGWAPSEGSGGGHVLPLQLLEFPACSCGTQALWLPDQASPQHLLDQTPPCYKNSHPPCSTMTSSHFSGTCKGCFPVVRRHGARVSPPPPTDGRQVHTWARPPLALSDGAPRSDTAEPSSPSGGHRLAPTSSWAWAARLHVHPWARGLPLQTPCICTQAHLGTTCPGPPPAAQQGPLQCGEGSQWLSSTDR